MDPLTIAAIGAGGANALAGIGKVRKQKRTAKRLISRAYTAQHEALGRQQGDIRQGINESLNARGVFNAGATAARPLPASAQRPDLPKPKGTWGAIAQAIAHPEGEGHYREREEFARDSRRGETGAGNTYAGGVNRETSDEFYKEYEELDYARDAAVAGADAAAMAGTANAIAGGVQLGTSLYSLGSGIRGAFGIPVTGTPRVVNTAYQPPATINYAFNLQGK